MSAVRTFSTCSVHVNAEERSVTFIGNDGRTAGITYIQSPGVTEEDVAMMYSEDEAMQYINDANDMETAVYVDASLEEARAKGLL